MPRKKKNWELEYRNIHNNPEQFYYKYGDIGLVWHAYHSLEFKNN